MTDRSRQAGPAKPEAADGSSYYADAPLIAYYGPDGQIAYHPAPAGYQPPSEEAYAGPAYPLEEGQLPPDPGWAALREAVWDSGQAPPHPWAEGPSWGQAADPAPPAATPEPIEPARAETESPPAVAPTLTVPVTTTSATKTAAHKVVPRPTAAHRMSTPSLPEGAGFRPSQVPYRIGIARRLRSGFALILISVVLAGLLAAVLIAVVAGIASAISNAASS